MRMPHSLWRASGPFDPRGVAVDRELRLAIQDGEHLLNSVVEVLGRAASGHHLAAQNEIDIHVHLTGVNERRTPIDTDGAMRMAKLNLFQIRMSDAIS